MEDKSRIDKLEKEVAELKTQICSKEAKKKEKKPRAPSEYNTYVSKCLAEEKTKMGANYNHKEAFKNAAESWSKKKKST
jgi:hypothetical protein